MYIALNFTVLLVAILLAWFNQRRFALIVFSISLLMAISIFLHHMTDTIGLSL